KSDLARLIRAAEQSLEPPSNMLPHAMLRRALDAFGFSDQLVRRTFFFYLFDPRPDAHGRVHAEEAWGMGYRLGSHKRIWCKRTARASGSMHQAMRGMATYATKRRSDRVSEETEHLAGGPIQDGSA